MPHDNDQMLVSNQAHRAEPDQSRSRFTIDRPNMSRHYRHRGINQVGVHNSEIKLPAFTGKESWQVWINRFEMIAERRGWDDEIMLDQLLPRLQGEAGEFVFTQLPRSTWSDYDELVKEISSRYRKIETSKTFASKFARRTQKVGEKAEEFAADLKRLYDSAHRYRDERTRQEDLVRRFLDGLRDDEARFEVEFNKEPENIDDAVYHVVNFIQTRRQTDYNPEKKGKRYARRAMIEDGYCSDSDSSADESQDKKANARRVPDKRVRIEKVEEKEVVKESENQKAPEEESENAKLLKLLLAKIEELSRVSLNRGQQADRNQAPRNTEKRNRGTNVVCYKCSQKGHYARECTNVPNQNNNGDRRRFNRSQGQNRSPQNCNKGTLN